MSSPNASFYDAGICRVLLTPLKWFLYSVLLLMALIVVAWIIDCIFVFKVSPDGAATLTRILANDVQRTDVLGGWHYNLHHLAVMTANALYEALFKVTGIDAMASRFSDGAPLSIPDTIARDTYVSNYEVMHIAMTATQLFGVRLATLLMCAPFLVLAYLIGMADGLVQRAIRRLGGGHESATLYHRAKYLQLALLSIGAALFLILPISFDIRSPLLLSAVISSCMSRYQWTFYKKHV
jgi:integrating conjugative element membrane protein (TIGR03747 family)